MAHKRSEKSSRDSLAARPEPKPQVVIPKYLTEESIPLRKLLYWVSKDDRFLGEREDVLQLSAALLKRVEPEIEQMLDSDNPLHRSRAIRAIASFQRIRHRAKKDEYEYRAKISEQFVQQFLGQLQAEMEEQERGVTSEEATERLTAALQSALNMDDSQDGDVVKAPESSP